MPALNFLLACCTQIVAGSAWNYAMRCWTPTAPTAGSSKALPRPRTRLHAPAKAYPACRPANALAGLLRGRQRHRKTP